MSKNTNDFFNKRGQTRMRQDGYGIELGFRSDIQNHIIELSSSNNLREDRLEYFASRPSLKVDRADITSDGVEAELFFAPLIDSPVSGALTSLVSKQSL